MLGKAGGGWTELAARETPFEAGKPVHMRVVAKGPEIEVFVDGQPVLSAQDNSFTRGSVGVRNYFTDASKVSATFGGIQAKEL